MPLFSSWLVLLSRKVWEGSEFLVGIPGTVGELLELMPDVLGKKLVLW